MSDIKRQVEIIFSGKDDLSGTCRKINSSFTDLGNVTKSIVAPLASVGKAVVAVDAAIAAMAIGGMALAISKASEFETSFQEISTLFDATGEHVEAFRNDILEYAQGSVKSIEDINGAVYSAISAGVNYEDAIGRLNIAEQLSVAGKAGLNDTMVLLASTMNAYGAETNETSRYADAFFRTVQLGQTTLPELASSLSQVTGVAATANVPIESLTAAVAALTAYGLPTTQAMTGLKAILGNIVAPTEEARKAFDTLHVEYGKGALAAKGLDGVIADMVAKSAGNESALKRMAGGVEGFNAASFLGTDISGKYADAIAGMGDKAGVTAAAYVKMKDTIANINQALKNNFNVTLIEIGDRLIGSAGDLSGGMTSIFQGLTEAIKAGTFDDLFEMITDWGTRLADFLEDIGEALPEALEMVDFEDLRLSLEQLGDVFGDIFADVDLTTPEGLAKAIRSVVDVLALFVDAHTVAIEGFRAVWGWLNQAFLEMLSTMLDAVDGILGIGSAVAKVIYPFTDYAEKLDEARAGLVNWREAADDMKLEAHEAAVKSAANAWDVIKGRMDGSRKSVDDVGDSIKSVSEDLAKPKVFDVITEFDYTPLTDADSVLEEMFPNDMKTIGFGLELDQPSVDGVLSDLNADLPESREVQVITEMDDGSLMITNRDLTNGLPGHPTELGGGSYSNEYGLDVKAKADKDAVKETKEYILKELDLSVQLAETAIKYSAEVDIAQIEASTKVFEASIGSVNLGIEETTKLITAAFEGMESSSFAARWEARKLLESELKLRQQEFDLQKMLIEAKVKALEKGDLGFKIDGTGLEPALELVLWQILEKVQIRANESEAEFLLGIQ